MHDRRADGGSGLQITTDSVDSGLGRWSFGRCVVPRLAHALDFIWYFDGSLTFRRERTFPSGMLEIIVHLGEETYGDVHDDGVVACPRSCFAGLQLHPLVIESPAAPVRVLGIRLTPIGASALIGRSLADATGCTVDLTDVMGFAAEELVERCRTAIGAHASLRAAVAWLEPRLVAAADMDRAASWAVAEIRRRAGAVSMSELYGAIGLSRMRFSDVFRSHVGTTPKQYARIVRFRTLLDRLPTLATSLADAAQEAGYYDQAHMNNEFKTISGLTPREFLAANRYPNAVSLAEA